MEATKEEMVSNVEEKLQNMNLGSKEILENVRASSPSGNDDDIVQNDSNSPSEPVEVEFHFPEEVWEMILNELTEDEDRTNCCRAFPLFDKLLTKSKPVWMFKKILRFIKHFVGHNDKLTCRRICKQWCTDIDDNSWIFGYPGLYLFDSVEKIDSFIQTFDGYPCNPFIDRTVTIDRSEVFGEIEFDFKILDLFSTFGKYIWNLEFSCTDSREWFCYAYNASPHIASYLCLQQILTRTTNLRKLWCYESDTYCVNRNQNLNLLLREVIENPLPPIPTLETLWLFDLPMDALHHAFINTLVSTYSLHLNDIDIKWGSCNQVFSHQFPKLVCLTLNEVPNDQDLESLMLLTAPLRSLNIGNYDDHSSFVSITALLRVLNNFPLLEEVSINAIVDTRHDCSHTNWTVRNLSLKFWNVDVKVSFNFLHVFKVLEKLDVSLRSPMKTYLGKSEGEGNVQLYKIILEKGQIYESNIWTLIPSLKAVYIYCSEGKKYKKVFGKRKEFEKHQARRQRN